MDALSNVVQMLRLKARVFLHSSFCGEYAVETSGSGRAAFHVVVRGSCWLHREQDDKPVHLNTGDLVMFPHDAFHVLSNSQVYPGNEVPRNQSTDHPLGEYVQLICGDIDFMQSRWNPILESLPDSLVLRRNDRYHTKELKNVLAYMIDEARAGEMGADAVIDRLSDVLFIYVLRAYLASCPVQNSYLAALFDERIGPVLKAVHDQPSLNWTVQSMADKAGMSRSKFADHFHQLVGVSPIEYLTNWRMQVAYEQLESSARSTAQIAEMCGYQSESSFSKSFKKHFNVNPGVVRRHAVI